MSASTHLAARLTLSFLRPPFSNHAPAVLLLLSSISSVAVVVAAAASSPAARHIGAPRISRRSSNSRASSAAAAASSASSPGNVDDEFRFADDYDALTDAIRVTAESLKEKLSGTPIYLVGMMGR